jgi:ATP adenylyltransferase/5',5'''-P-1,P-4-tetraphosphate phosphorylase II
MTEIALIICIKDYISKIGSVYSFSLINNFPVIERWSLIVTGENNYYSLFLFDKSDFIINNR